MDISKFLGKMIGLVLMAGGTALVTVLLAKAIVWAVML